MSPDFPEKVLPKKTQTAEDVAIDTLVEIAKRKTIDPADENRLTAAVTMLEYFKAAL